MKFIVLAVIVAFGVLVSGRSIDQYTPEEENFALGVDAYGHALGEPFDDAKKNELMSLCTWYLLQCWFIPGPHRKSKCGHKFSDCIERAKKGIPTTQAPVTEPPVTDEPVTEAPVTDLPPPPIPDE